MSALRGLQVIGGVLLVALASMAVNAVWIARRWEERMKPLPAPAQSSGKDGYVHDVRGALHCHSSASDGAEAWPRIAEAARASGLAFVVITDHRAPGVRGHFRGTGAGEGDAVHALRLTSPRYEAGVLMIPGGELSTDRGHLLYAGVPDDIAWPRSADAAVTRIREAGGMAVIAHPERPSKPWKGSISAVGAMEVLNLRDLLEMPRPLRLWTLGSLALLALVRPQTAVLALNERPDESLSRWDRESTPERPLSGFLGLDAHGASQDWGGLGPGYREVFTAASTHVLLPVPLTGDAARDSVLILKALETGHSYFAWDLLGNPAGFRFEARRGDGDSRIPVGEAAQVTAGWRLEASLPRHEGGGRLRLYRDGTLLSTGQESLTWPLRRTGVYRIEVWIESADEDGVPWIYSNMIGVRMFPPTGTVTTSGSSR